MCLPGGIFHEPSYSGAVSVIYYTLNQVLLLEACALGIKNTTDMRSNDSSTPCDRVSIQSVIASSTVGRSRQQTLNTSVKIVLQNRYSPSSQSKRTCVFWEYENPLNAWSSRGCHVVPEESTNEVTTCRCTHFTLFAVLLDPYNVEISGSHRQALELISTVGCSVSLAALTCTILVTLIFWRKLESVRTKVLLHLCFFLAGSCVLVIIADRARESETYCKLVAVSLHFTLLSAFCWMLCEGILLYCVTTVMAANHEDKIKYFYLLGWGVPAVIVIVALGVSRGKGYGRGSSKIRTCWLTVENGLIWLFVAPASVVLLINIILLIIVVKKALSTHVMLARTQLQKIRAGIKAAIVSLPLLGITWTFGLLAFNSDTIFFKYMFAISNSLQGLMIFVFHCALNKQIQEIFMLKIMQLKQRSVTTRRVEPAWF
ncbi:adhesion G-protein coupled receptor D1-like [Orbicella faveolata]|uniref:adhesion G-protein coupled receptor D1-like n=1 Tax=Orbicella faveolata TaxID=48498 RepID=UPI0009E31E8D|nr:adhesion G-protein coupled receptor D1-like [Orbicella faveolata]